MRIALIILFTIGLSGCGDTYRYLKSGELGWALKKEIRDRKMAEVNIAKLTKFEWNEFFIFEPYQPSSEICKRLQLSFDDCKSLITTQSTSDDEMLMVFRDKGKIVHTELHIRWHGDFSPLPDKPWTPQTAVFSVVVAGKNAEGKDWLQLRPVPQNP